MRDKEHGENDSDNYTVAEKDADVHAPQEGERRVVCQDADEELDEGAIEEALGADTVGAEGAVVLRYSVCPLRV